MHRVLTLVHKDIIWARGNLKLLGVMVLPVFLVVFFSWLDSAATFVFSLTFVNAFVGIFSTSYLIIEEKNRGTLLALLTTPLTSSELLLGKFLFNLILCLIFSLLAVILNNRVDSLTNPLVLLTLLFFAGTTCFFGFVMGLFFKNEQEMSVIAPFVMLIFCFGSSAQRVAGGSSLHAFLPDYHVAEVLKDLPWTWTHLLFHTLTALVLFLVSFAMAIFYTRFYFANNREKRFSSRLFGLLGLFILVLVTTGGYVFSQKTLPAVDHAGFTNFEVHSERWQAEFLYDPDRFEVKRLLESRTKNIVLLLEPGQDDYRIAISLRQADVDEQTAEERQVKLKKDTAKQILLADTSEQEGFALHRWLYLHGERLIFLTESFCSDHLIQVSLDQKLEDARRLGDNIRVYEQLVETSRWVCN